MPDLSRHRSTSASSTLTERAMNRLKLRLEHVRRRRVIDEDLYRGRCCEELDVIQRLSDAHDLLEISNVVDAARSHGIRVGPGRGATPCLLVNWALGISDIDPIRFKLPFERFLNPARASTWIASIDVCARRHAELVDQIAPRLRENFEVHPLPAISLLQDVVEHVKARHANFDLDDIADDDGVVFAMISNGDTAGVFWFDDHAAFTALAQRLAPTCFDDLMLIFTVLRPGPTERGVVEAIVDRKHRWTSHEAIHPALGAILADTYGVLVYQEQVIRIAHDIAGFSY